MRSLVGNSPKVNFGSNKGIAVFLHPKTGYWITFDAMRFISNLLHDLYDFHLDTAVRWVTFGGGKVVVKIS